ncbi:hypothetical protein DFH29DRAFT_879980 [Suillus ampliporus]|nr:hypothetical protein DFH29DRAFT_879980 [Suillus ampliporus]
MNDTQHHQPYNEVKSTSLVVQLLSVTDVFYPMSHLYYWRSGHPSSSAECWAMENSKHCMMSCPIMKISLSLIRGVRPSRMFKATVMHTCGGKGNILLETIVYSEIESATITKAESSVKMMQDLASELCTLAGNINEKKLHLKKIKADIQSGNFDECLSAKATKAQSMQDQHDTLDLELHSLSMQVESRAHLDLEQAEMWSKASDIKNILESCNIKF